MSDILSRLQQCLEIRRDVVSQDKSYVQSLLQQGDAAVLKKLGEEAVELVIAAKDRDDTQIVRECADLWFHCLVLLVHCGLSVEDVLAELLRREGISGTVEKANRGK